MTLLLEKRNVTAKIAMQCISVALAYNNLRPAAQWNPQPFSLSDLQFKRNSSQSITAPCHSDGAAITPGNLPAMWLR